MPTVTADRKTSASRRRTSPQAPAAGTEPWAGAASGQGITVNIAQRVRTRLVPDCGWPTEDNVEALRPSRASRASRSRAR